jgi:hypothetical protein
MFWRTPSQLDRSRVQSHWCVLHSDSRARAGGNECPRWANLVSAMALNWRSAGSLSALSGWFFGVGWFNSSFSRGSLPACKHRAVWGSSKILPATVENNSMPKWTTIVPVGTRAAITDSMQKWSGSKPLATKIAEQEKGWGPRSHRAYQNMFLSNFMRKLRYETKIYRNFLLPKTYERGSLLLLPELWALN